MTLFKEKNNSNGIQSLKHRPVKTFNTKLEPQDTLFKSLENIFGQSYTVLRPVTSVATWAPAEPGLQSSGCVETSEVPWRRFFSAAQRHTPVQRCIDAHGSAYTESWHPKQLENKPDQRY